MNRQSLFVCCFAAFGVALWAALYRRNHPPLSEADKQFRAFVEGADSAEITQREHRDMWKEAEGIAYLPLDAEQTRRLIEELRLRDKKGMMQTKAELANQIDLYQITFKRAGQELETFTLRRVATQTELEWMIQSPPPNQNHYKVIVCELHPRFESSLRALLDEVLPDRIKFS